MQELQKDMLLMRMKKEDFEQMTDTNLVGTFNVTKINFMLLVIIGVIANRSAAWIAR